MYLQEDNIHMVFHPDFVKEAEDFYKVYDFEQVDFITTEEIKVLKPKERRICRFCKKPFPVVKFETRAHTIPEFLGNTFSLSDFECDVCNKLFGEYEKQLSNYLGISTTVNRTKGKKKIPSFISYNKKIEAKRVPFYNGKKVIRIESVNNQIGNILPNSSNTGFCIEVKTQPYIPIDVYKAFLKMALGLLADEDVGFNELAFDFLQKKEIAKGFVGSKLLSVYTHHFNRSFNYNGIVLFKRRNDIDSLAPLYTMILFYGQSMFQIYLPLQKDYLIAIAGKAINCPLLPPVLPDDVLDGLKFSFTSDRLDQVEAKTSNQMLTIDSKDVNEEPVAINFDGKVDEDAVYDPNIITQIIIIDDPAFKIQVAKDHL